MAVATMLDRAVESDFDTRFIAQASALGTLADDVVADLIRSDEGVITLSSSRAIQSAFTIFKTLVAPAPIHANTIPRRSRVSDTLRRLTAAQASEPSEGQGNGSGIARLGAIADALEAATKDSATSEQISFLMSFFEAMAGATMDAAQAALHRRGSATSWLTI